ncbi:UDP-N-acetylmuramoyl-tripeptide--D-alanyl-D-alanine ligase [Pukyongiella litopenaei]|uniref:UDP-N-acetylmuramoyl-tripeptide--D-alanyl-D-alanine ligase n=1 Tax=Pukyongiella litopenaei TaxID=2605946 RepID=A0A2S0MLG5_9RHOB|nr:UDP-N-acetylmuramoyl-tripeptide--D-alanyl-D-alanine ligase [Pukyongiella litopenaei]AVO36720.1 UDP-N-acetylmuramoyl-tripeptide--D-alanyl-D-alanine ligase [Pukyongiella litopenaei]
MSLWTAAEAAAATGGQARGDWIATGVSIDSRTLAPGDLFVALTAARDGHDFVAQALENGAAAALVSRIPEDVPPEAPLLLVGDVQAGLEALGRAGRDRSGARVVAVTGSVGKTSTKEMLARMLGDQGRTHASVASYNNHWGVPLTLARMPRDTGFAVIEIGMNHPGEIAPLARQARPHVALVTTVAPAHLEAFASIEAIAAEKASVFEGLEPGGVAIVNADLETTPILRRAAGADGARIEDFGRQAAGFRLLDVSVQGDVTVARADADGNPLLFRIRSPGAHFAMNGLGALAACRALGADLALAAQSLGRWTPYKGRGAREVIVLDAAERTNRLVLIDDSYNANPASMAAALEVLAAVEPEGAGRRIAILGDMKELGPQELDQHAALAALPAMQAVDRVECAGPLMRALHAALPADRRGDWAADAAGLLEGLGRRIGPGDVVLVKASLSMGLGGIVDAIRKMGHGGASFGDGAT